MLCKLECYASCANIDADLLAILFRGIKCTDEMIQRNNVERRSVLVNIECVSYIAHLYLLQDNTCLLVLEIIQLKLNTSQYAPESIPSLVQQNTLASTHTYI